MELNQPLSARKAEPHVGSLASRWGLVTISSPNIVLTSVNPGPSGSMMVRMVEATGASAKGVKLQINAAVDAANESNLMEANGRRLTIQGGSIVLAFHPFEIKTIRLQPAGKSAPRINAGAGPSGLAAPRKPPSRLSSRS